MTVLIFSYEFNQNANVLINEVGNSNEELRFNYLQLLFHKGIWYVLLQVVFSNG
jgi:hypothetical protein